MKLEVKSKRWRYRRGDELLLGLVIAPPVSMIDNFDPVEYTRGHVKIGFLFWEVRINLYYNVKPIND